MKNIKNYFVISLFALLMLSVTACAEIPVEAMGSDSQLNSHARSAADTQYTGSSSSSLVDARSADQSSSVSLKYRGTVDAVTVNTLTLNGQTFSVATTQDLTTLFTQGSTFEIEFRQNRDGTISIDQFHAWDGSVDYDVEFKGIIDAVTADTITLNGTTYTVVTTEDLTTLFASGEVYEVKYLTNADGTITIVAFHSEGDDYDVEFKGMVDAVTADTITLNGETFTVATTEDLTTLFTAGEFYEIKYLLNSDGTITIIEFHFEDSIDDMNDDSSDDDWDDSDDDHSNNNNDDNNNHNNNDDNNSNDDNNHNNSNDD